MSIIINSPAGLAVAATPLKDAVRFHLGGGSVNANAVVMAADLPIPTDFRLVPADAIVILQGGPSLAETEPVLVAALRALAGDYGLLGVARTVGQMLDVPPVDEAQVAALASVVDNLGREWSHLTETALARRLYLAGVRVETGVTA